MYESKLTGATFDAPEELTLRLLGLFDELVTSVETQGHFEHSQIAAALKDGSLLVAEFSLVKNQNG